MSIWHFTLSAIPSHTTKRAGATLCVGESVALCRLPPLVSVASPFCLIVRVTIGDVDIQACVFDHVMSDISLMTPIFRQLHVSPCL
jgi:hypothetical protein